MGGRGGGGVAEADVCGNEGSAWMVPSFWCGGFVKKTCIKHKHKHKHPGISVWAINHDFYDFSSQ